MSVFDNVAYVLREQAQAAAAHARRCDGAGRGRARARRACSTRSRTTSTTRRCGSRAASSSGCASPARWPPTPRCCCSTSPARRSIPQSTAGDRGADRQAARGGRGRDRHPQPPAGLPHRRPRRVHVPRRARRVRSRRPGLRHAPRARRTTEYVGWRSASRPIWRARRRRSWLVRPSRSSRAAPRPRTPTAGLDPGATGPWRASKALVLRGTDRDVRVVRTVGAPRHERLGRRRPLLATRRRPSSVNDLPIEVGPGGAQPRSTPAERAVLPVARAGDRCPASVSLGLRHQDPAWRRQPRRCPGRAPPTPTPATTAGQVSELVAGRRPVEGSSVRAEVTNDTGIPSTTSTSPRVAAQGRPPVAAGPRQSRAPRRRRQRSHLTLPLIGDVQGAAGPGLRPANPLPVRSPCQM